MTEVTLTPIAAPPRPKADRDVCSCCAKRGGDLRRDLAAWWLPSDGYGYGEDGRLISLCEGCILTLQFFVETK